MKKLNIFVILPILVTLSFLSCGEVETVELSFDVNAGEDQTGESGDLIMLIGNVINWTINCGDDLNLYWTQDSGEPVIINNSNLNQDIYYYYDYQTALTSWIEVPPVEEDLEFSFHAEINYNSEIFSESDSMNLSTSLKIFYEFEELEPLEHGNIATGDIDSDGDIDIILNGKDQDGFCHALIYENDGNGHFTEINKGSLRALNQGVLELVDIDKDNDLDLIELGWTSGGSYYYNNLYKNDGSGNFTEFTNGGLKSQRYTSCAYGDIDGDNDIDLILNGWYYGNPNYGYIYANNGSGVFTEINTKTLPAVSDGNMALGDIDNDNDLDLIITGDYHYAHPSPSMSCYSLTQIFKNNGSGKFTEVNSNTVASIENGALELEDIDNDNDLDLILIGLSHGETVSYMKSDVYKNTGNGTFNWVHNMKYLSQVSSTMGDINDDGYLDLIYSGFDYVDGYYRTENSIILNNKSGYLNYEIYPDSIGREGGANALMLIDSDVELADLDNDSDLDLIITSHRYDDWCFTKIYKNSTY